MMLLREFLSNNTLISNTYGIFDYQIFSDRFNYRLGRCKIRDDVELVDIPKIAQNAVDINEKFLRGVFSRVINPFETWGENGGNKGTKTEKIDNTLTITHGAKNTQTQTGDETLEQKNIHSVSAYNKYDEQTPENSDEETSTRSPNLTTTSENSGVDTNKTTADNNYTDDENYNKTGYNMTDFETAWRLYLNAYDILINFIVPEILLGIQ